jgi:3-hydroxy acid dehydrogenase / malonic semialdehyde reductase
MSQNGKAADGQHTALVTGATSGIGRAIASAMAAAGYHVLAIGRDMQALSTLRETPNIEPLQLDVTDRESVKNALIDRKIDVLVNNAGMIAPLVNFCDADQADIDATLALNVSAVLHITRLVAPGMRARGHGHIFFTGSTAGHAPFANLATYCASKAAISGFAGALRLDLAPHGARVTEIVAGRVETALYRDILPEDARAQMYANHSAVQPDHVAQMVIAVLNLPNHVDVQRFDISPTHQSTATGVPKKG